MGRSFVFLRTALAWNRKEEKPTESSPYKIDQDQHFLMLDGRRGIAACAIVLFHTWNGGGLIVNGPLAVDFFFLLSGFVIAYSYEERLMSGMAAQEFVVRRIIRLYPMVFVAAFGGLLIALVHNKTDPAHAFPIHSVFTSGFLSLFLIPYLGSNMGVPIFSFNPPLWSLAFELIANLIYVLLVRRLSMLPLAIIVIIGLVMIGVGGPLGGGSKATVLLGFPRVACGFFGGVLLFKLFRQDKLPRVSINFGYLSIALFAVFCFPYQVGGFMFIVAYSIFLVIIICSLGAPHATFKGICSKLGVVSYPMYLIHWLTLYIFTFVGTKIGLHGKYYLVVAIVHFLCVPFIAYFVDRVYDKPVRKLLHSVFLRSNGKTRSPLPLGLT